MGVLAGIAPPLFVATQPLRFTQRRPLHWHPNRAPRRFARAPRAAAAPPPQPPPPPPKASDTATETSSVPDTLPSDALRDAVPDPTAASVQWYRRSEVICAAGGVALLVAGLIAAGGADAGDAAVWAEHAVEEFIVGPRFFVSLGMGLSAFIQALTGFGFAIVSVGALTQVDWIVHSSVFDTVQPVAATLGALTGWILLVPEIKRVRWKSIRTLLISSTIATPAGIALLGVVDGGLIIRALGAIITGYVAYSLAGVNVPRRLGGEPGAWLLGLLAGALGGAFDITGPPLVIHGEATEWNQEDGTFRRNLLAVVSINSTLVVLFDAIAGRLDDFYYYDFLKYASPSVIVGILVGNWLSKKLDPAAFKKVVLGTCLLLGGKLLLS